MKQCNKILLYYIMANSSLYNLLYKGQKGGGKIKSSFTNFITLLNTKKQFLIMIFANLIAQLGITYYVMSNTNVTEKDFNSLKDTLLFISTLVIIFILVLVPMPNWLKFILFSVFSYIWGIFLAEFKFKVNDNGLINMAMLGSIGFFILMFLVGVVLLATGIQLGLKTGLFLFISLLILIIAKIFSLFHKSSILIKSLSAIGIVIFSGYIIYDTNTILQRNYHGDFITASLDYYLDILNIFSNLVLLNDN